MLYCLSCILIVVYFACRYFVCLLLVLYLFNILFFIFVHYFVPYFCSLFCSLFLFIILYYTSVLYFLFVTLYLQHVGGSWEGRCWTFKHAAERSETQKRRTSGEARRTPLNDVCRQTPTLSLFIIPIAGAHYIRGSDQTRSMTPNFFLLIVFSVPKI